MDYCNSTIHCRLNVETTQRPALGERMASTMDGYCSTEKSEAPVNGTAWMSREGFMPSDGIWSPDTIYDPTHMKCPEQENLDRKLDSNRSGVGWGFVG